MCHGYINASGRTRQHMIDLVLGKHSRPPVVIWVEGRCDLPQLCKRRKSDLCETGNEELERGLSQSGARVIRPAISMISEMLSHGSPCQDVGIFSHSSNPSKPKVLILLSCSLRDCGELWTRRHYALSPTFISKCNPHGYALCARSKVECTSWQSRFRDMQSLWNVETSISFVQN